MGYQSEVAFAIEFENNSQAQDYFNTLDFTDMKWMEEDFSVKGDFIVFHNDYLKWYEDYHDIKRVQQFYKGSLDILGCKGYGFIRLGENNDDIEEDFRSSDVKYDPPYDALGIVRGIEINV